MGGLVVIQQPPTFRLARRRRRRHRCLVCCWRGRSSCSSSRDFVRGVPEAVVCVAIGWLCLQMFRFAFGYTCTLSKLDLSVEPSLLKWCRPDGLLGLDKAFSILSIRQGLDGLRKRQSLHRYRKLPEKTLPARSVQAFSRSDFGV